MSECTVGTNTRIGNIKQTLASYKNPTSKISKSPPSYNAPYSGHKHLRIQCPKGVIVSIKECRSSETRIPFIMPFS